MPHPTYWFLGTPLTGHEDNLGRVMTLASDLTHRGVRVLPIIVMGTEFADDINWDEQPYDWWMNWRFGFLASAKGLIVFKTEGWKNSKGLLFERQWCAMNNRPIFFLSDPYTISEMGELLMEEINTGNLVQNRHPLGFAL